jgi:Domain of unknown function (DUF5666)
MNQERTSAAPVRFCRPVLAWSLGFLLLAGCGGDGENTAAEINGGVPVAVAVQGAVTATSPLTVNGQRFTYAPDVVTLGEGDDNTGGLQPGMVVRVQGGQGAFSPWSASPGPGRASSINSNAELLGAAEVVPSLVAPQRVLVNGVVLRTTASTRYDNISGGLDGVLAGDWLQVHGYPTHNGALVATRILKRNAGGVLKVTGVLSWDTCGGTCDPTGGQIVIGQTSWRITRDAVRDLPFPVPEGTLVRIRASNLQMGPIAFAQEVIPYAGAPLLADARTTMRGVVTAPFASPTESGFYLNGLRAVYDKQVNLTGGTRPDVNAGVLVEIKGLFRNGQLSVSDLALLP